MDADAHPEGQVLLSRLVVEAFLKFERGLDGVGGVDEPEHEAVAQFLDNATAPLDQLSDDLVLHAEQVERRFIALNGGELGEAREVSEDDRPFRRVDGRTYAGGAHRPFISSEPDILLTFRSKSEPCLHSQCIFPLRLLKRTLGSFWPRTVTFAPPDTIFSSISSEPAVPISTPPLIVDAWVGPSTRSTRTRPLLELTSQRPAQRLTAMLPLTARASRLPVTVSMSTPPETADIFTEPKEPLSLTLPEIAPTETSVPTGQRTSILPD